MKRLTANTPRAIDGDIDSRDSDTGPRAYVVDGTLVLSLPDAITPIVWRLDLNQAKASALEVRPGDNGIYALVSKTPRSDINEIASYEDKAGAVRALMTVSRAMESAQGQVRLPAPQAYAGQDGMYESMAPATAPKVRRRGGGLMSAIIALLLAMIMLWGILHIGPSRVPPGADQVAGAPAGPGQDNAAGASGAGEPVSADTFLQGRQ